LEPAWGTFAAVAGVEPTTDAAERALRGLVRWRKGSEETAGAAGSRFVASILTAVATCPHQGRDVLAFVTGCSEALRQDIPHALSSHRPNEAETFVRPVNA
jgi:transposase